MNETNNMTPEAIALQVGDAIAKQLDGKSDRYILVYVTCALIIVLGWMAYYFLKRMEKLQERSDSMTEKVVDLGTHCRIALENNTQMLGRVTQVHERVIECLNERN